LFYYYEEIFKLLSFKLVNNIYMNMLLSTKNESEAFEWVAKGQRTILTENNVSETLLRIRANR